jgi:hypothetical protein
LGCAPPTAWLLGVRIKSGKDEKGTNTRLFTKGKMLTQEVGLNAERASG